MSEPVVVKVGGSLFAAPGAMSRVGEWLASSRLRGQTRVLIAGGGAIVEALRRIDSANPLTPAAAHWGAIDLMDANAGLLAAWFPAVRLTDRLPGIEAVGTDLAFRCGHWLRDDEPRADGERLTVGWQTTSDAIAARIAVVLGARLVILKHSLRTTYASIEEAAGAGVVDHETPRLARRLSGFELIGITPPNPGNATV